MKNGDEADQTCLSCQVDESEHIERSGRCHPRWWLVSLLLASGTFVVGTDAFVVAGLLPKVADSLNVSTGRVGSVVTVFSPVYAISAVPLAVGGSRLPRRFLLFSALVVVAVGNLLTVASGSLTVVLIARSLTALGAAAYTAGATSTAAAVAGERKRGQAVAIVLLGMTSALVLGSPLGAAISAVSDWHMTFLLIAAGATAVALPIILILPKSLVTQRTNFMGVWSSFADRRIVASLVRTLLLFSGVYLVYTYLSTIVGPRLVTDSLMTVLLATFGISASVGTAVAGRLMTDLRRGGFALNCCSVLMIAAFFDLMLSRFHPIAATVMVGEFGAASFGSNPTLQTQLITYATPQRSHVVTALFQSVLYIGAATGAGVGTGLLPLGGSTLILAAASLLVLFSVVPSPVTTPIICNSHRRHNLGSAHASK